MTFEEMQNVLRDIKFHDWDIDVFDDDARPYDNAGHPYLQVHFGAPDRDSGDEEIQAGRKWFLSYHMTKSELVQTAFLAVMTAVEHEVRESFFYKAAAVFGPHNNIDALASFVRSHDVDRRVEKVLS